MSHPAEAIERLALEEMHALAPPALKSEIGIESEVIGSAFVSRAKALPASAIVINRAIGVGLDRAETEATLAAILSTYAQADIDRYFVQVHPDAQPANIAQVLIDSGLEKARGWQKFSRGRKSIDKPTTDLTVREVGAADAAVSARIVCDGFDLGDAARPWLELLPGSGRWHVFMTFDGEAPAGSGALFIDGDTRPGQTLARRLQTSANVAVSLPFSNTALRLLWITVANRFSRVLAKTFRVIHSIRIQISCGAGFAKTMSERTMHHPRNPSDSAGRLTI